jgi:hypothetical protein
MCAIYCTLQIRDIIKKNIQACSTIMNKIKRKIPGGAGGAGGIFLVMYLKSRRMEASELAL